MKDTLNMSAMLGGGALLERGKKKNNSIKLFLFNYYKRQKKTRFRFQI